MWDEMLKESAPDPRLPGATINFHQSRATALAATGKIGDAKAELAKAAALMAEVPEDAAEGHNVARPLYQIGQLKAQARIANAEGRREDSITALREAVGIEDRLAYNEPSDMIFPTRHLLGAELMAFGKPAEAEAVYRDDLKRHPNNGWAYLGLSQALAAQKKDAEAEQSRKAFDQAWQRADTKLTASAF
jgi:tetratricopeptide (TPR) repeat protein